MEASECHSDEKVLYSLNYPPPTANMSNTSTQPLTTHPSAIHPLAPHPTPQTTSSSQSHSKLETVRSRLGLHPHPPVTDEHLLQEHHQLLWSRIRLVFREFFAEFFGTFVMVMFGNGSVAQVLLSTGQKSAPGGDGFGAYQSISWG